MMTFLNAVQFLVYFSKGFACWYAVDFLFTKLDRIIIFTHDISMVFILIRHNKALLQWLLQLHAIFLQMVYFVVMTDNFT